MVRPVIALAGLALAGCTVIPPAAEAPPPPTAEAGIPEVPLALMKEVIAKLSADLRASRHTVRGDGIRLQQVFWNLINNAMKFTGPDGQITVRSADTPGGSQT